MSVISAWTRLFILAADADHDLRQPARFHLPLHERAGADFDVENERIQADSELFRHDRRRDQRNGLDGRRRVAERVQLSVGGRDLVRLPDKCQIVLQQAAA